MSMLSQLKSGNSLCEVAVIWLAVNKKIETFFQKCKTSNLSQITQTLYFFYLSIICIFNF